MKKIVVFLQDNHHIVLTEENISKDRFRCIEDFVSFLEDMDELGRFIQFKNVPEKVKDSDKVIYTTHIVNTNKIIDIVIQ